MQKRRVLEAHRRAKGKIAITAKIPLKTKRDLSIAYTPGVAEVSKVIAKNKKKVYEYTMKGNAVAIVTDGSAVLGLGNLGPEAALPVMEGKSLLFKKFANIDAFPICLKTQDCDEIVNIVKNISPGFGGINLEDISAPRCFEIEERLQNLSIPVFHDDQHGTAIAVVAGLINASKVVKKRFKDLHIVINGAGAAGTAIAKLIAGIGKHHRWCESIRDIMVCDRHGIIYKGRRGLNKYKKQLANMTNKKNKKGSLKDALEGADVFIGVSAGNLLKPEWIKKMNKDPIIFALANPTPEIMPHKAKKAGAKVIATGRSDFPNQINNALVFPGIFRGALDARIHHVTHKMKIRAAEALASCVKKPHKNDIIPSALDKRVVKKIANAIK